MSIKTDTTYVPKITYEYSNIEVKVNYVSPFEETVAIFNDGSVALYKEKEFLQLYAPKESLVTGWIRVVQDEYEETFFLDEIHSTEENARRGFEEDYEGLYKGLQLIDVIEIKWNGVTPKP